MPEEASTNSVLLFSYISGNHGAGDSLPHWQSSSSCAALQSALDPPGMQLPVVLMHKPLLLLNFLASISDNQPAALQGKEKV
jgi:hypothetical protein